MLIILAMAAIVIDHFIREDCEGNKVAIWLTRAFYILPIVICFIITFDS